MGRTSELSGSRRQERWSAQGASELPPSVERRSGAAVRSSDLVRHRASHAQINLCGRRKSSRCPKQPDSVDTQVGIGSASCVE